MGIPICEVVEGDCVAVMSQWPAGSVDLVFADPPYNSSGSSLEWIGKQQGGDWFKVNEGWDTFGGEGAYLDFSNQWIGEASRLLREGGSLYVCATFHGIAEIITACKAAGLRVLNIIVWEKTNPIPTLTGRMFGYSHEYLVLAVKGRNWTFNHELMKAENQGKQVRDVWRFPVCQGGERVKREDGRAAHPTQKPEALVRRAIAASSREGDLVLDPFLGSGTTAVVSQSLARRWCGIELSPEYVRIARERIEAQQVTGTR